MWKNESDFEGVFKALEFLAHGIPVNLMSFGIISHPVIQSSFVRKEGFDKIADFQEQWHIINEKTTEEVKHKLIDLQLKRIKEMARGDIKALFILMHKPYCLELLNFSKDYLTRKDYSEILLDCWTDVEFPHQHGIRRCVDLFKLADRDVLIKNGDKSEFDKLPNNIVIYRGLQGGKSKARGLSWTTDLEIAKWFAKRWNSKGKVYQAEILKDDIFLYTNSRNEKEVIVNPYKLKGIKEIDGGMEDGKTKRKQK